MNLSGMSCPASRFKFSFSCDLSVHNIPHNNFQIKTKLNKTKQKFYLKNQMHFVLF